jgi:trehalose-6-phosphate synthase
MSRIGKAVWGAYYKVNLLLAKVIVSQLHDGDSIRIHDYHLMLLLQFLREKNATVGIESQDGIFSTYTLSKQ